MQVIDFAAHAPNPAHYPTGVIGAMRYVAPRRSDGSRRPKCITDAELEMYRSAGKAVGFVFEDSTLNTTGGARQGDRDGKIAVAELQLLKVPAGVCCYAAADHDLSSADLPVLAAYLDAFHRHTTDAGYRRGLYAELSGVDTMLRDGHVDLGWQTVAWSGKDAAGHPRRSTDPRVVLYQRAGQISIDGTTCDVNDVLAADWGQWDFRTIHHTEEDDDMRPIAATPSWCHRQPNGLFPQFRAIANDDASTTIVSVDNAPFAPAWHDGQNNDGITDFAFYGLWCRKFPNTGQPYGFGEADGALFLIAEHGTYDIAHA